MIDRDGIVRYIREFIDRNLHRSIKYSVSGFIGFLFVELFTFILFHYLGLPNLVAVPPSFIIGVAIEYLLNEFWTTREAGVHSGRALGVVSRLLKFELTNLVGTSLAILVQYLIYTIFGVTPLIGNIIGSWISFPVNYYIQMKVVWRIRVI